MLLGHVAGPELLVERDADAPGGSGLTADVNGDFLVVTDANGHQAPYPVTPSGITDTLGDVVENTRLHGLAVQQTMVVLKAHDR